MGSHGEAAKESKRYVKMTAYFNKRPDLTEEEFHHYWSEEHGPLFRSLPIVKEKILKYNQYHISVEAKNKAASLGFPVMEFDGVAELWAADMDSALSVFQDPEYLKNVVPDETKFATHDGLKLMVGYDELVFDRT